MSLALADRDSGKPAEAISQAAQALALVLQRSAAFQMEAKPEHSDVQHQPGSVRKRIERSMALQSLVSVPIEM